MLHAAAGASAATAWLCLAAAAFGAGIAGAVGFWLGLLATLAALAESLKSDNNRASTLDLRVGPGAPVRVAVERENGAGHVAPQFLELRVESVAPAVIHLRADSGLRCALWCDAIDPDAFRRLAALGRWRRVQRRHDSSELIRGSAVTAMRKGPRSGWPRPE